MPRRGSKSIEVSQCAKAHIAWRTALLDELPAKEIAAGESECAVPIDSPIEARVDVVADMTCQAATGRADQVSARAIDTVAPAITRQRFERDSGPE